MKASLLEWHPAALRDLEAIVDLIAEDSPEAAERFATALFERVELLQRTPDMGPPCPHAPRARQLGFGSYLVYYTCRRGKVVVRAVVHGARLFRPSWLRRRG